jgi:hypothetical protein
MKIFNMNKSIVAVRCLVSTMLLATSVELCGALIVSSSPPLTAATRIGIIPKYYNNLLFSTTNSYLTVEYSGHNNNNIIGEGLFRSFRSNCNRGQQQQQQHMNPKYASRTATLLPLQVVKIVPQMIRELVFNKKRYISIIAAAIIAFGSFPSHVMAEQQTDTVTVTPSSSTVHKMQVTPTITLISQTPTMIESDYREDFLQYNDDDGDHFFATRGSYVEEESTSTSTDSSMLTTETTEHEQEAQDINYDSKNDHMSKVIGAVGGVLAGSTVTRMALFLLKKDRNSSEIMNQQDDDHDDDDDNDNDNDNDSNNKKTEIIRINSNTDRSSNILPLCDPKYVQARKQPKSQKDEALLAARYGAISGLEEKAYQILVDLGMIEVHHSS